MTPTKVVTVVKRTCPRCGGSGKWHLDHVQASGEIVTKVMPYECPVCLGQRDRLIRAAFDAFYAEGTPFTELEEAIFGQVVDAVLAALRSPPD